MPFPYQKVVLTGAASGIGWELLCLLGQQPIQIVVADWQATLLEEKIAQKTFHAKVWVFQADLALPADNDALFDFALLQMGSIALFVANAGFAYYEQIGQADWQRIEKIYQVNVFAPLYAAQKMRELCGEQPYAVCITASSMAHVGIAGYAMYASTKAALHRFAESYRAELPLKARLTLVYPIATRTAFFANAAATQAPVLFPTQEAATVARAMMRGIARRQNSIYPSRLFWLTSALLWGYEGLMALYRAYTKRVLHRYLEKNKRQP